MKSTGDLMQDEVVIHPLHPLKADQATSFSHLTDAERSRACRFHFEKDATHWIACRAGLRKILSIEIGCRPCEVPIIYTAFGKPILAPPFEALHFNLSHCEDLALVALCLAAPVGIDLEALSKAPTLLECADSFCHPQEIDSLPVEPGPRSKTLVRIWTGKESLLKALGTGLSHPPESICLNFSNTSVGTAMGAIPEGVDRQRLHELDQTLFPRHQAFVCVDHTVEKIRIS